MSRWNVNLFVIFYFRSKSIISFEFFYSDHEQTAAEFTVHIWALNFASHTRSLSSTVIARMIYYKKFLIWSTCKFRVCDILICPNVCIRDINTCQLWLWWYNFIKPTCVDQTRTKFNFILSLLFTEAIDDVKICTDSMNNDVCMQNLTISLFIFA